jgi:translocator protein
MANDPRPTNGKPEIGHFRLRRGSFAKRGAIVIAQVINPMPSHPSVSMIAGRRAPWSVAGLIAWIGLCFAAAAIGVQFQPGGWYAGLKKPSFNPPDAVFGPVWTALYTMMGVAAWLVWRRAGCRAARWALTLFVGQLALNAAWSWLFFGLHRPGLAFAEIVVLWLAIAATLVAFWRWQWQAGALMAPYLAWVGFAAVLNFSLWRLNA